MSVARRPEWELALASALPARNETVNALAPVLGSREFRTFLEYCRRGTLDERDAAVRLLLAAHRIGRLPPAVSRDWIPVVRRLAAKHFAAGLLGAISVQALHECDKPFLERFLLRRAAREISEGEGIELARRLSLFSTPKAVAAMRALTLRGDAVAAEASRRLAITQPPTPAEVRILAAAWRNTRTLEALSAIYYRYVVRQYGKPIKPLLKVLGRPTEADAGYFRYQPKGRHASEGPSLQIHVDEAGRVEAFNLK
jgi:hypothetical protein